MTTTSRPTQGLALQITQRKQTTPLTSAKVEITLPGPHEILLQNVVAAQAVADALTVDLDILIPSIPHTNGCDCSGVVLAVGKLVKGFQHGDRVCASANCSSARHGSYQEFPLITDTLTCKIPSTLSHEAASTFPLAYATAFLALHALGLPVTNDLSSLPFPSQPDSVSPILIWGGASSLGAVAVQLAKLCGYKVITTATPKNHEFLRGIGADFLVDYHDGEKAVREIVKYSEGKLALAYDPIMSSESLKLIVQSIGPAGGRIAVNLPGQEKTARADVEVIAAASRDEIVTSGQAFAILEQLLAQGRLTPHPLEIIPGGLSGVDEGWRRQRAHEISATKLVYRIPETPGLA